MYTKVDHEIRLCKWCQNDFKPNTSHQKFCSRSCYKKYGKKFLGHSNGNVKLQQYRTTKKHHPYRKHKKLFCKCCGFVPEHPCQLDVDHIDGNHFNNDPNNLQTLCANCHRLKTAIQLGWTK